MCKKKKTEKKRLWFKVESSSTLRMHSKISQGRARLLLLLFIYLFIYLFIFVFCPFRSAPAAYGGSQTRGPVGAVAAGLHHSHSNARSKLRLRPIPQLTATHDP